MTQPLTAMQLSRRTGLRSDACRRVLGELAKADLVRCLNPSARRSRLYWLTESGVTCGRRVRRQAGHPEVDFEIPNIDWDLYGWVCYRHRAAILKTIVEPMQPATIKRKARSRDPTLRMSANNVRDVMRLFREKGIIQQVWIRKKKHPRYELTDVGKALRQLLIRTESPV